MSDAGAKAGCSYVLRPADGQAFGAAIPDASGGSFLLTADLRSDAAALSLSLWLSGRDGKPLPIASLDVPVGCVAGLDHFIRSTRAPGRAPDVK